ncbi:serine/threonine-protein kinase [Geminocystis sp. NIES-3709]|uniref:serine/threonine-protein kinase n=1 Tax=Geminocystis sp. NIES-3709 TaxID=1617448 RepID=UPI0005FC8B69|nr:serine/threonine-protein kinase [Geminocystis sp. NIES-3709]BAQ64632.1 serine/threonine kinase [Geminocystis sp. NIES-3709]
MIISYCVNPDCSEPKNHPKLKQCNACGSNLILNHRYRAIKMLGKGGFGATFVGVDLTVVGNPLCVIKQLRPMAEDAQAVNTAISLFEREAKTLGKINHPQIPKLMDYFVDNDRFYLIQELINGQNLQREVKTTGVYGELALRRFLEDITPILKYLHSERVIHRDIKPANILRQKKDEKLVLIDFGAVKDQVNTQLAKTFGQTALTKFSVGTMGYAPPEQLAMRPIYSSDIFALGATCVYLVTGKSPKNFAIDPDTGKLLWQENVNISSALTKVIDKMLAQDTKERYKTVDELIEALNLQPFQQSLSQNINKTPSSQHNVKDSNMGDVTMADATNSQLSQTLSATARLEKAIQDRKSNNANKIASIKWDTEKFLTAFNNGKKDFSDQNLQGLNLVGGKLNKCIFRYSQLQGAIFTEASLSQANFYGADLSNADLTNTNLVQTYFSKSNLENADLKGANLGSADLTNANLTNANLCGANLKNAKVNQQQLKSAKVNWNTILPDGSRRWWKMF